MGLIEQLEAARGPSRDLDSAIADHIGIQPPPDPVGWPPRFSESIDAALTLYKQKPERVPSDPIKACVEALYQWL